jgi:hypothetical protein
MRLPRPLVSIAAGVLAIVPAIALASQPLAAQDPLHASIGNATGDLYGAGLAHGGDVDADGLPDLLVGAPGGLGGGYLRVLSAVDGAQIHRIPASNGAQHFGASFAALGDADGDGFGDFAVGAPGGVPGDGMLQIISGQFGLPMVHFTFLAGGGDTWPAAGASMASLGDLDADGQTEFAVGAPSLGDDAPGTVTIMRFQPPDFFYGTIHGVAKGDRFGSDVDSVGDVDGDDVPDFVVGSGAGGYARVHSGATLALLRHFTGPGSDYGRSVAGVGDLDLDGTPDIAVASPGLNLVDIFSGATGNLLRRFDALSGGFGSTIESMGDLDGDGVPDLAVGAPDDTGLGVSDAGSVVILSGATGAQLFKFVGNIAGAHAGGALAALPDADADGERELAIGATGEGALPVPAAGRAAVYSSVLAGLILPYGFGCPDSFLITPALELIGEPSAGGQVTLSITRGFPGSTAFLFLGTGQGLLPLANGCILWVDPTIPPLVQLPLGGVFPGSGAAMLMGSLPADTPPGVVLTFQAFEPVLDTPGDYASTAAVMLTTH